MDERAAFEKAIDENPTESTHHAVYADWLEEHGEHEEAAFRRSMADFMSETPKYGLSPAPVTPTDTWAAHRGLLPKGVKEVTLTAGYQRQPADPTVAFKEWPFYHWTTYRGMEEAFRRSFKAHHKADQFARHYSAAVRKSDG